jgi:hypothetical protein
MLIASRRLQLITARKGGVGVRSQRRAELLAASRQMVTIYVQLGAGKRLQHCDICEYSLQLAMEALLTSSRSLLCAAGRTADPGRAHLRSHGWRFGA